MNFPSVYFVYCNKQYSHGKLILFFNRQNFYHSQFLNEYLSLSIYIYCTGANMKYEYVYLEHKHKTGRIMSYRTDTCISRTQVFN